MVGSKFRTPANSHVEEGVRLYSEAGREEGDLVLGVQKLLEEKFDRSHEEIAIVKKSVTNYYLLPGVTHIKSSVYLIYLSLASSKCRCPSFFILFFIHGSQKHITDVIATADLDVVEVSAEEEEDEQAGPSHSIIGATNPPDVGNDVEVAAEEPGPSEGQKTSAPAPAEEDIPTPAPAKVEDLITTPHQEVIKKIPNKIISMKERHRKTIKEFRAHIRKSQAMLKEFNEKYAEDLQELSGLQEQQQNLP
ncbi:uncharacterized protein LOC122941964 [Bufo gargarizans]|uniref:uncharacterized protein LOC122941964 n=1 Tax=Bufo gargarizans TaxID=30331 RepID=UPI001CF453B0|nr:uncharacterized protein LOC122941964 [Bufo gargarizans]